MSSRISRRYLSSLASALSSASSRRAICRRWTRSLVRMNSTRHPFSTSARPMAAAKWLLPPPGGPNNKRLGALFEPTVACGQGHHLRLADHRHQLEVEAGECFTDGQPCFGQMTLDAAATAIGDLMFGERGQEASGRPAFLVSLLGELGPHQLDGGQAQFGEQELDARGVEGIGPIIG